MFTFDQKGRPASPQSDLQKTICGSCVACQVRLNFSADPRLLPCLHTVCNACLTKICTNGETQDCPLCAQSFLLSEVTECAIFADSPKHNKALKCAGCEESEVTGWCVQCEEALCLDCTSAHRRVKVTRDHEVTPKKPPEGWTQRRRCPLHTQESLKYFCLVCEELTCKDCQLITHRGHSFVQQEEAVEFQRKHLESLLDSIKRQKEMLSRSLMLLEARLLDIEDIKVAAKKMLVQVFHTLYRALVQRWGQIFIEINTLYKEEVRILLERKTSLNKLEGSHDYISAFIDKILSAEGHCLLVRTKKIDTQVERILTQETCTPKTMTTLHIQLQKNLYDHIINIGFMKITKYTVPFSSQRTGSTQSASVSKESSNPNSVQITTDVPPAPTALDVDTHVQRVLSGPALHPCGSSQSLQLTQSLPHAPQPSQPSYSNQATTQTSSQHVASSHLNQSTPSSYSSSAPSAQVQSHNVISGQSKHAYSSSLNYAPYSYPTVPKPYTNPSPSVYAQPQPPLMIRAESQVNKSSKSAKRKKTWTYHYYPAMKQYSKVQTPVHNQNQQIPANKKTPPPYPGSANNQTPAPPYPIPANSQTPAPPYSVPANNQTAAQNHPALYNSQASITTQPIPVNNPTSVSTHSAGANDQTPFRTHPIPANNQTCVQTHLIPTSSQTQELIQSVPTNNQTSIILQPIPSSIQTPLVAHAILVTDQTPYLTHPITANDQTLGLAQQIPSNQISIVAHAIPVNSQSHILPYHLSDNNQTPVIAQPLQVQNQSPVLNPPNTAHNQTPMQFHPIELNNPTPVLTHPVSNIPSDTQRLTLTHPMQTSFMQPVHSFAAQPNFPLNVSSNMNTLSLNDMTPVSNVHSTGSYNNDINHCPSGPCSQNPTIPAGDSSLHGNCSALISCSNTLWSKREDHNNFNVPVKALADSACDRDAGVSSSKFTDSDRSESNLPTSTMSETDSKETDSAESIVLQDTLFTTTEKYFRQAEAGQSSTQSDSGTKHWRADITTFRHLVETACSSIGNLKATSSTTCSTSEDLAVERLTRDKKVQSCCDHSKTKEEADESPVTLENFKVQLKQLKRSPSVSLVRLPITVPSYGQPLPEFYLTTDTTTGFILVQECQEGQVKQVWKWADFPLSSKVSSCSAQDSDIDNSPASDVQFCALCESAGAALLCAKCGCAFHSDCHIPPVLTKPREDWVCLLCQDVNETITYDSEDMRTSSLSLQDQRKCEKLLLGLLCEENRCLLYSATKNRSKTPEFDIILGRLLGKRKPPYRTAGELVSDLWTLFDILYINAKKKSVVVRLQKSFQQRLQESFGNSLHVSLLKHFDSRGTSDSETQKEKHRNTLKRMREFFIANCGTTAKKPCTEKVKERKENGEN